MAMEPPGGNAAARAPDPFYPKLRGAYEAHDVDQVIKIASDYYLTSAIRKLSDLLPIGQAAYTLLDGMGLILQEAAVDRFFAHYAPAEMVAYQQNDLPGELTRAYNSFLAVEALRLNGSQGALSYTRLLKALYGLSIAHWLQANNLESFGPLTLLFQMPVFVPGWVWELDPCDPVGAANFGNAIGTMPPSRGATELAASALIQRRNAFLAYSAALAVQGRSSNEDRCKCICDDSCVPQSPCCAKIKSFVTDLLVVRSTLQCYLPSDIAYIENVLAGEERTREHERLLETEQKQEIETTVTSSEERDLQVSERFDLSSETSRTIEEDTSSAAGVTVTQKWGPPMANGSATATANISHGIFASASESAAQNFARDVVERSVSKIEKKARQFASRSVLSRTRELNKHVFDRRGQDLTVGIYTWVSKMVKAQVYSYGRRMVYEFILPDPAALCRALLIKAFGLDEKFPGGDAPVAPPAASSISAANYLTLAIVYGVNNAPPPPETTKNLNQDFSGNYGIAGSLKQHTQTAGLSVPPGYAATSMSGRNDATWGLEPANVVINLGTNFLRWQRLSADKGPKNIIPPLEGQLKAVADDRNVRKFSAHLVVECTLKADGQHAWQSAVHHLLVEAYQKQKDAYDATRVDFDAAQAEKKTAMRDSIRNRDPFINRETERTELKRLAISWLSCQHFDRFNAMKRRVQPCGLPQMNLPEAEEQGKAIRFWEQALDWDLMTYLFYPYFWSAKCTWAEKFAEESGDGLFDKFMQAGAAQVQVPVTEGFEDHMQYWEKTGRIWGQDGEPPRSDTDAHWLSMVQEIKHQQDCYLNDREGRIDTKPPSNIVTIKGSDRYWDPWWLGDVDLNAIALDLDREIVIETVVYRIVAITRDPGSPNFDVLRPNSMWWRVTLDRPYEGAKATGLPYAVGVKFVGAPWMVTVPTNLIWLKNDKYCLPCYPLQECASH